MKTKKFKLFDAILATVCITLVSESVAPTAAIGNSQYFWWMFLILAFCLPYGLITAELGSSFPSEGGLYTWVKKAFGPKWASRVAWNYWINFPLWVASLAVAVTDIVADIFSVDLPLIALLGLQLLYVWITSILGCFRVGENKWIINLGTLFKITFMVGLGILGIYVYITTGTSANPIESAQDLLPTFDLLGLSFLSVIIFNFLGLEVIATYAEDMEKPKKDIPKAVMIGALLTAIFYLLPATGINIALPVETTETAGITGSFASLFNTLGMNIDLSRILVIVIGLMFIYALVANIVSWSFGVNAVAKYSADDNGFPKYFGAVNKDGVPYKTSILNGIVATIILIIGAILGEVSDSFSNLFWTFFSLSLVTLLLSYVPLFLSFKKLRKIDKTDRAYKIPGNSIIVNLITYVPLFLLIASLIFTIFIDFTYESFLVNLPLIIGVIISLIIQEIIVSGIKENK